MIFIAAVVVIIQYDVAQPRGRGTVMIFIAAVVGDAVMKIYDAQKDFRSGNCQLPKRYYSITFYVIAGLTALAAGAIALVLQVCNPVYAFLLGVNGPKIVPKLVKKAALLVKMFMDDS